ncbi:hypothetical protein ACFVH6_22280 [Spirillospora sp. NPDC127200]
MGIVQVIRVVLECDGCQTVFGAPYGCVNAMEARGAAYAEGWRFPSLINRDNGKPMSASSDVCPTCVPGWEPKHRRVLQRRATEDQMRQWIDNPQGGAA